MGAPPDALARFLAAAAARFAAQNSPFAAALARDLAAVDTSDIALAPAQVPACAPLTGLASGPDPLLAPLAPCLPILHWKAPGFGKLPAAIADHMAVAELVGPVGMCVTDRFRFGLLIQGAHLTYPDHRHAAGELYLMLGGRAEWSVDGAAFTPRAAGALIHHAPGQPHAMRTFDQPMLAAWAWYGDIASATYQV